MALTQNTTCIDIAGIAGSTLTSKQYYAVSLATDGKWDVQDGAGGAEELTGILQTPTSTANPIVDGDPITVRIFGISKAVADAAIEEGVAIASNSDGQVLTVTGAYFPMGYAIEPASAAGDIIQVFVCPSGQSNA